MAFFLTEGGGLLLAESSFPLITEGAAVTVLVLSVEIACSAYIGLNSTVTIEVGAGAPVQGGMRQLATDRWNYMYPSN